MYKVITHTIKEEHFTHPETAKIAMGLNPSLEQAPVNPFEVTPAIDYRDQVKNVLSRYNEILRSYLISAIAGSEDAATLGNSLTTWAQNVCDTIFGGYLLPQNVVPVKTAMSDFTKALEDGITAIKNEQPLTDIENKVSAAIDSLSARLALINRANWPKQALVDLLMSYKNELFAQAQARVNKKWDDDLSSADRANKIILAGPDDGTVSLADLLSKGMILLSKGMILLYRSRFV